MSQNDFVIADQTFPATLADLNAAFQALASASAGAAAPGTTYAYQLWADTTNNLLKMRNGANTAWLTLAKFDTVNDRWELRGDVLQALSASGLVLRDSAGVALAVLGSGQIYLNSARVTLRNAAGTEVLAEFIENSSSVLKFDNVSRFWTTSTGVEIYGALEVDTINGAALAGGYFLENASVKDWGTQTTGTIYAGADAATANFQKVVNGGAFTISDTLVANTKNYGTVIHLTNNASAGAITLSLWEKVLGDAFTTVNGAQFLIFITKCNGVGVINVVAL